MFKAIRSKIIGAWSHVRERGFVSLFLFELLVVTLGVLLAQAIADWADERAAYAEMEAVKAKAETDIARTASFAALWDKLMPCFEQRMQDVMQASARGETLEPATVRRPAIQTVGADPLSADNRRLIDARYGEEVGEAIFRGTETINQLNIQQLALIDAWEGLGLIDRANGPPSQGDRDAARRSASKINNILHRLQLITMNIANFARVLGLEPADHEGGRPVRNCEEMWDTGYMYLSPGNPHLKE